MKTILRIQNAIFLYRASKDLSIIKVSPELFLERLSKISKLYKTKHGFERKLMYGIVKQLRKTNPYRVEGWAEREKLYKEYFQMDKRISSFRYLQVLFRAGRPIYLKAFRSTYPVKGKRLFEYDSHTQYALSGVVKIVQANTTGSLYTESDNIWIDESNITAFIYASPEEIDAYETEKSRKISILKKIEEKQNEVSALYEEMHNPKPNPNLETLGFSFEAGM